MIKARFKGAGCGGDGKTDPITEQSQSAEISELYPPLGNDLWFQVGVIDSCDDVVVVIIIRGGLQVETFGS